MLKEKKEKIKWYESGQVITTLIIVTILAVIICSQSFAVMGNGSLSLFTSVINHNSMYLLLLVYFVLLKTKFGKRYFNYLNVFLIFIYIISTLTTFLTLIQSFSLTTIFGFLESFVLLIYLFHTMFRDTRVWKEFHLGKSPFNEISNDAFFDVLLVLIVLTLVINLISTVVVSGLFVSILDAFYILLFGRYIYLYREYLDFHKLDSKNEGNFDEIRKDIQTVLDSTTIDDKIVEIGDKVKDMTSDMQKKEKTLKKESTNTEKKKSKKIVEKGVDE